MKRAIVVASTELKQISKGRNEGQDYLAVKSTKDSWYNLFKEQGGCPFDLVVDGVALALEGEQKGKFFNVSKWDLHLPSNTPQPTPGYIQDEDDDFPFSEGQPLNIKKPTTQRTLSNKDRQINKAVAFKGAIDYAVHGLIPLEDVEIWADRFNEYLNK